MEELIKLLSKQNNLIKKTVQSLKQLSKDNSNLSERICVINTESKTIEKILNDLALEPIIINNIKDELNSAIAEKKNIEQKAKSDFGRNLSIVLAKENLILEGNFPKYKVSLYTILVDFSTNIARIYYGPEFEKIDSCKPIPEEVGACLINYNNELVQRDFEDKVFLDNLFSAYNICLLGSNKHIGYEVPIPEILSSYVFMIQSKKFKLNPLKKYYVEYDRVAFSYDIHRLKERIIGNHELKLVTARRADTARKMDFLWIPPSGGKGNGESVSRIKFTQVD